MSNKYEIKGRIKVIGETQTFASGFSKREFVVTVPDGQYPQDVKLELLKDKVSDLDALQVSDEVTVHFNIRGSEYKGKYYVNLVAWRIEQEESAPSQPREQQTTTQAQQSDTEDCDDIPF